ncbi:sensor histidine kinase [Pararhodonellum marinum]|uniref:sensor histidine kinase n=1 Tax=Pararhodonellum marinum TaxID=2755358 RepID=UPI00188E56B5|nr:ATP-binding protein [Pararhodonellum marinum]
MADTNEQKEVIQDLREKAAIIKLLEASNAELTKRNEELDSFNHFISHDLQEPLRKIQLFISRLEKAEDLKLQAEALTYFEKIKNSAHRMQQLIHDLLVLSHTSGAESKFEKVNLGEMLEIALQELGEEIAEKDAIIHRSHLPEINGIPFQLVQLFKNLLGNSLKYVSKDSVPEIKIGTEPISPSDVKMFRDYNEIDLVKITVQDNGIGFDQKHAEKIFEMFKRLHGKNEYSGTGIGLSICKKIMENHKGFIFAKGIPNQGALFTILLPKNLPSLV